MSEIDFENTSGWDSVATARNGEHIGKLCLMNNIGCEPITNDNLSQLIDETQNFLDQLIDLKKTL